MNPLMLIKFGPYAVIVLLALALGIQGMRLTHAEQEFQQYKLDQQQIIQQQIDQANKQRKESSDDYQAQQKQLEISIQAGEVFRRCVAAGKCGVRVVAATCPAAGVSPPGEPDGIGEPSVPAPPGPATEMTCEGLANDAAKVQLELNKLQTDIESQPGYAE